MNEQQAAEKVTEWALAVLPELAVARSYLSAQKTVLPDVMVDVAEKRIALTDDRFPRSLVQQAAVRVFEVEMFLMVAHEPDPDEHPNADREESEQLRDFGARLEASLMSDGTLGGRVPMASPIATFNYRLPFVQYRDGTRGRQATISFPVADLIQPEGA